MQGRAAWPCHVYKAFREGGLILKLKKKMTPHFLGCQRYFNMVIVYVLTFFHLKKSVLPELYD